MIISSSFHHPSSIHPKKKKLVSFVGGRGIEKEANKYGSTA